MLRSFLQLTAVGYVINIIFRRDELTLVIALVAAMAPFGAVTARAERSRCPCAFWLLLIALDGRRGDARLVVALGIFPRHPALLPGSRWVEWSSATP